LIDRTGLRKTCRIENRAARLSQTQRMGGFGQTRTKSA
jgi:hypothetical protein